MPAAGLRLSDLRPRRTWARPGETIVVEARLAADRGMDVALTLDLVDGDTVVATTTARRRAGPRPCTIRMSISLPTGSPHGYGLVLKARGPQGSTARSTSAIAALEGWWQAPRHAALTDFRDARRVAEVVGRLRDWHVTVLQHYDWMWRHYRYEPPGRQSRFRDTLGRVVSHTAVRAGIRTGHGVGMASLAYGSVYGAEQEHVLRHPEDRVFDATGQTLSLGGTFHINDLRPGSPWRRRLLGQYRRAVGRFGFDGIHMDTYGPPHRALSHDGEEIDFAALYPALIDEAAGVVAAVRPGARVLLNCVEGFPLERVARAPVAALYLELWPPDDRFADVTRWVRRARHAGDGRAVIVAAYALALAAAGGRAVRAGPERAAALEATHLLTSVIAASGAFHHTLADDGRLIVEGYYPAAVTLHARESEELRSAWRFCARYLHLLSGPDLREIPADPGGEVSGRPLGIELTDPDGSVVPLSAEPRAGHVWVRRSLTPGGDQVVHLVDLLAQSDDRWTEPREPSPRRRLWRLRWPGARAPWAASPWTSDGDAWPLRPSSSPTRGSDGGRADCWALPPFRRWLMLFSGPASDGSG